MVRICPFNRKVHCSEGILDGRGSYRVNMHLSCLKCPYGRAQQTLTVSAVKPVERNFVLVKGEKASWWHCVKHNVNFHEVCYLCENSPLEPHSP